MSEEMKDPLQQMDPDDLAAVDDEFNPSGELVDEEPSDEDLAADDELMDDEEIDEDDLDDEDLDALEELDEEDE